MQEFSRKIIFIGNTGVGKTSIITRFDRNDFLKGQVTTIGFSMIKKSFILNDQTKIFLKIWDTAGQERFRSIVPTYYRDADVVIIVYQIDDIDTFTKLQDYIDELHNNTKNMPALIIVGNKKDLDKRRKVRTDEAEQFAESHNAAFCECSAMTNDGIDDLFNLIGNIASETIKVKNVVVVESNENENAKNTNNCCLKK